MLVLRLSSRAKIKRYWRLIVIFNFAMGFFKAFDIVLQGLGKSFGMLWRQDDSRLHFALWNSWHNINKINHKFRNRMVYNC